MSEESIGDLIIRIMADASGVKSGCDKADDALDKFSRESDSAKSSAKKLQTQLDATGKEAKNSGGEMDGLAGSAEGAGKAADGATDPQKKLADALKKEGDDAETAGNKSEVAGDKMKKMGEKGGKANDKILDLDGAIDGLIGKLSWVALGGALFKAIQWMVDLQTNTVNTYNKFRLLYQDVDKASDALYRYRRAVNSLHGDSEEEEAAVGEQIYKELGKDVGTSDYGRQYGETVLDAASASGYSGRQIVIDMSKISEDYGLDKEESIANLGQIVEMANQMKGDFGENFSNILSVLTEYDNVFKSYGFTYDEVLGMLFKWGNERKDLTEEAGRMERQLIEAQDLIGDQPEKLAEYTSQLKEEQSNLADLTKEQNTLIAEGASAEDIQKVQELIDGVKTSINDLKEQIKSTEALQGISAGKYARGVWDALPTQPTALAYSMAPRGDKDQYIESSVIAHAQGQPVPTQGVNTYQGEVSTAFNYMNDWREVMGYRAADAFYPTEATASVQESLDTAEGYLEQLYELDEDTAKYYEQLLTEASTYGYIDDKYLQKVSDAGKELVDACVNGMKSADVEKWVEEGRPVYEGDIWSNPRSPITPLDSLTPDWIRAVDSWVSGLGLGTYAASATKDMNNMSKSLVGIDSPLINTETEGMANYDPDGLKISDEVITNQNRFNTAFKTTSDLITNFPAGKKGLLSASDGSITVNQYYITEMAPASGGTWETVQKQERASRREATSPYGRH